jgi:gamma-glutamyl:cysteine ligase YbdK (ATP-grasp superfamily)
MKISPILPCLLLASSFAAAQQAAPVAVKPTPASDALVAAAKDAAQEAKDFQAAMDGANAVMAADQKALTAHLADLAKQLDAQLKADKRYKGLLDQISATQNQLKEGGQAAQAKFDAKAGPIQAKLATDQSLMDGLEPVVRKENGLPDTAKFDRATQTWSAPAAKQ